MEKFTADRIVTINVDVQNDFLPGGSLAVTNGDEVIAPLNSLNEYTRVHKGIVIATGDQHPETTPHFDIWPVHCVAGTEGAALADNLDIKEDDVIINKGMGQTDGYSGLEGIADDGQTIESIITPVGRERVAVLLGGVATDYCDLQTVLDALRVDPKEGTIKLFVVEDAIRAVNIQPDDGENAIAQMQAAGAQLVQSIDILTGNAIELAK
ncbi:MAG TPA: isochorismatase family protein [Candidatus Microsaccharimonas sp.]|jgi:nicotinamidase/pyrazinamidase